jgi:large subunit ribosomal protein L10
MSRKLKELMVDQMADQFSGLQDHGCVMIGFKGVSAEQSNEIRALLAQKGAAMMVVRNRLFAISLQRLGASELSQLLDGPTALITSENAIGAAKAADEAAGQYAGLNVLGGYGEGRLLGPEEVQRLARLPDRETLLAQALSCMQAPARRLVNCLNAKMHQLASVFRQLRDQKEKGSSEQAGAD